MTSKPDERSAQKPGGGDPAANLPFSRVILVEQVPEAGTDVVIQASAAECAALAALDGLAGIGMLEAHFHVAHRPNKGFNVSGHVRASISPICVVSLEAFEATVEEDIDVDFAPQADLPKPRETKSKPETARSRGPAPLEEQEIEPPDPIVDGKIDLGSLASEFLALALDPYPRKPGAQFEEFVTDGAEEKESPFAILRRLDKTS